ncbi:conserved hypothetical protein [Neospora caninum Liverpool]|uniref:Transmembrane protein n=1 Tax=Neospora caninum (strain Liverpool) TaxID=572307 RepID=F0VB51_NEOCL|nr:conserved hypothetical protein [Neospora caninum Liverpool]CBZ51388.1 conserved hypothetical protein [Neospora caninum Liverpool]CEL68708.1 TPA: hypothetical protein BN1204_044500 [Neospora caninum Liverpool]|eukprot:XP_003881421.1 conserved hypothetical protein [Neospora caninum Liverpool]
MKPSVCSLAILAVSVFTVTCVSPVLGATNVSGRIELLPPPESLPPNSFLTIQVADTSRADAAATVVVSVQQPITDVYNSDHELTYSLFLPEGQRGPLTVSAWLNVGWQSTPVDRIHRGDYLTTSHFGFDASPSRSSYRVNLSLKRYD